MNKLNDSKLFLLDMDGTLYLGGNVIDGAPGFVEKLRDTGRQYVYLTNNSSRAGRDYVKRLNGLGFPCIPGDVFTSGMATAIYLNEKHPGKTVHLIGTDAFRAELLSYGVKLDGTPEAVVCGFDTELRYEKLEKAVHYLRRGADFIASNPDLVCPMPDDEALPDCGSICSLLTAATGREPLYIGKPNRSMVDAISKSRGIPPDEIAVVGDRLYTDVLLAQNSGCVSVCVLSGETKPEALDASPTKPDYVFPSVKELAAILT
jgi:HAD superfamily hydrolase (TIGR01450 family)